MKSIVYSRPALKALSRLPSATQVELKAKMVRYAETGLGDVRRLSGRRSWRLRSGEYRMIFATDGDDLVVEMVGHRGDVYR